MLLSSVTDSHKAAEYVFASTQITKQKEIGDSRRFHLNLFLKTVKRMRAALLFVSLQLSWGRTTALAMLYNTGFVRKMSGTSEVDTDAMNRSFKDG